VTLSIWLLIPTVPLLVNLYQWRRDRKRVSSLIAARTPVPRDLTSTERVSFLVAAWNEESTIEACIQAILHLNHPDFEVILHAGGTDRTWEIASRIPDPRLVVLLQRQGEGKQASLQKCFERASGEIIYLLDAGCLITNDAFARILQPIILGKEQAITSSPCVPFPAQMGSPFVANQCAARVYTSISQPEYCPGLAGANSAIRRAALEQAGGFHPGIRTGGDYDLGQRLLGHGVRIRYDVEASFPIRFHMRVRPYLRQQARWLRNVVSHGMRFGAYREVASCLATSLVGFAMLSLPLIALVLSYPLVSPTAMIIGGCWAMLFLYACFSRFRYLKVASLWLDTPLMPSAVAMIPACLTIDFLAWSIPLVQYPSKKLRERW
jgi:cellulose synthase/poly-beta-1,6-N-acetylglucosamine synthase-like glycosyltransferase